MIAFTVVLCTLIAFSTGQYQPKASKDAAILEEARYLAVNGQFGSTYKQDDGVEFKEESDGQGNRKGSYSYIDPTGQRRTVTYTAGKDGFRPTGDHLPLPPVPAAPAPAVAPAAPSISSNSIQQTGQYNPEDDYQYQDDSQSQYRPSQDYSYNNNYQYNTPNTQQFQQPQYNPVQFQYRSPASAAVPAAAAAVPSAYNPSYNQYTSSEPPHRFFPPGKLSLNRSPDGFSYTFNKV